jgi:hypothetical protein
MAYLTMCQLLKSYEPYVDRGFGGDSDSDEIPSTFYKIVLYYTNK